MTLRSKILGYLLAIHVVLGAVTVVALWERPAWLLAAEAGFALSIALGWKLVRDLFVPLEIVRSGAELLRAREFTVHFRDVGQPEMDSLIAIYNQMADHLREERQSLAEHHVLLDKILRVSPSGIVILDFDDRILLINDSASRLLSPGPAGDVGRRLGELGTPLATQIEGVSAGATRVISLSGGRRLRARRVAFRDRGFERSFLLLEDLTEELRDSERSAYGKVIRMMSHEVKNSVGAVRSLLDSVQRAGSSRPPGNLVESERALEVASARLGRLDSFVTAFADVVRLPDPELRPCDMTRLIEEVLVLFGPELAERRIDCRLDPARPPALTALADKNLLEQVLVNILRNAIESIDSGGTIEIRFETDADGTVLVIADDGAGIAESSRPLLFTPFFSSKREGRGIGLTVVREILTRHGFPFSLEPRVGRGAEFRVRLAAPIASRG